MNCPKHKKYAGLVKPKGDCDVCQLIWENTILKRSVDEFSKKTIAEQKIVLGKTITIGALGDTQLGSLYDRVDLLQEAYKTFRKLGVSEVYHTGDLVDGNGRMYRGQEYELRTHGADRQVEYAILHYPHIAGITTHFITGNHDLSFYKQTGLDVGLMIADKRKDMIYLGKEEADVSFSFGPHKIIVRLSHPGKGTAYAISYNSQKYIESLSGGKKPHIVLTGHFHKSEFLPNYRNVALIQTGCLQEQTPFMRRQNIAAMMGFWVIEFGANEGGLSMLKGQFFPFYEGV